jgi:hypothetical protein
MWLLFVKGNIPLPQQNRSTIMTNELSLDTLDQVSGGLMAPQFYADHLRVEGVRGYQLFLDMKLYDAVYARQVRKDELLSGKPWLNPL